MAFSSPLLRRCFSKTSSSSSSSSSLPRLYRQHWDFSFTSSSSFTAIPRDENSDTVPTAVSPLKTPKLFISGLSRLTTDEKLKAAFSPYGQLLEANVITEMMNAKFLDGWVIFVDPTKPREPRCQVPTEEVQSETGFRINKTVGWCG